jgi:hypothetical protein
MARVDYKKDLKHLYFPTAKEVVTVTVPEMNFLMADGAGDPNTSEAFREAIQALYGASYTLKFMLKKRKSSPDYSVGPLEALWWSLPGKDLDLADKSSWKWTVMIMQPDFITGEDVVRALEEVRAKKGAAGLKVVRFEKFEEGLSAQIMHIGPYSKEAPTIERLHAYIRETGRSRRGDHHEIYIGDPRRAAPERMKTVIRQPMA